MRAPAAIGQRLEDVDTPALLLDLEAFEKNLSTLKNAVGGGVRVRAHAKTHKSPDIAKRQLAAGAIGVCCQKVSEAEAMVEGGIADVLVSNEVVGEKKIERLPPPSPPAPHRACVRYVGNGRGPAAFGGQPGAYLPTRRGLWRPGLA